MQKLIKLMISNNEDIWEGFVEEEDRYFPKQLDIF